jgi:hypothetical protein
LKRIADVAKQVQMGKSADTRELNTPGKRASTTISTRTKPGDQIDETCGASGRTRFAAINLGNVIKAASPSLGNDKAEVERIFQIISKQAEY